VDSCCSVKFLRVSQVSQVVVPCGLHCGGLYLLCLLYPYYLDFYTFHLYSSLLLLLSLSESHVNSRHVFSTFVSVPTSPNNIISTETVPGRSEVSMVLESTDEFFSTLAVSGCVLYSEVKVQLCGDDYTPMNMCEIYVECLFVCTHAACLRHGNNLFKTKRTSWVGLERSFFHAASNHTHIHTKQRTNLATKLYPHCTIECVCVVCRVGMSTHVSRQSFFDVV